MKTIMIFLIIVLAVLHAKVAPAVENNEVNVEKQFHNQFVCVASAAGENYELTVQWTKFVMHSNVPDKEAFAYKLKNIDTNDEWSGAFSDFGGVNQVEIQGFAAQMKGYKSAKGPIHGTIQSERAEIEFNESSLQPLFIQIASSLNCVTASGECGSDFFKSVQIQLQLHFEAGNCSHTFNF